MSQTNMEGNTNPVASNSPSVVTNMPANIAMMHQSPPQQMQQGPRLIAPQQPQGEKIDYYISQVKVLMDALNIAIPMTLNTAAQILHQNYNSDSNSQSNDLRNDSHESAVDCTLTMMAFESNLDEFHSICDQMELHLRSALACVEQTQAAAQYIPLNVNPSQLKPPITPDTISYTGYLKLARAQVKETKEMRKLLAGSTLGPGK